MAEEFLEDGPTDRDPCLTDAIGAILSVCLCVIATVLVGAGVIAGLAWWLR